MDPRNAHRGWQRREQLRNEAAAQWQQQFPKPPKEGEMYTQDNPNRTRNIFGSGCGFLLFLVACLLLAWLVFWNPLGIQISRPVAAVQPTQAPTMEPTAYAKLFAPTAEAPAPTAVPAPVSCDTPSIKAGKTAVDTEFGEYLDTVLGKRMTFTSRKVVVPAKAWNDPLTPAELKSVETTWLYMQVCVPEGINGRVFAGGFEQGVNRYENGILLTLKPGVYEFKIRNGEVVIWYPDQNSFAAKDLTRIIEQIKVGNFDIKGALAFFGVTTDILPQIPAELVKERNVQIVPFPDPTLK